MFYKIACFITKIGLMFWYRLVYLNTPQLPEKGFILACNHVAQVDPMLLAYRIERPIHFMAKKELFENKLLGFLLSHLNAFAVDRGTGDADALQHAVDMIEQNKIMGIFPEGTRSKSGEMLRPKSGMALISFRTKADILPAAVYFSNGRKFRSRVYICYGEVISFDSLHMTEGRTGELKETSKRVMKEIAALRQRCIDQWEKDGGTL